MADGSEALAALIARQIDAGAGKAPMPRARAMLSAMVGALTLARNLTDREAAAAALRSARAAVLSLR